MSFRRMVAVAALVSKGGADQPGDVGVEDGGQVGQSGGLVVGVDVLDDRMTPVGWSTATVSSSSGAWWSTHRWKQRINLSTRVSTCGTYTYSELRSPGASTDQVTDPGARGWSR